MQSTQDDEPLEYAFEINGRVSPSTTNKPEAQIGRRDPRIKIACVECKRRKIRCDGSQPCYSCRWYKIPERCSYPFSRPALIVTRKNFDSVRNKLEKANDVLTKLFPTLSIESLADLSREDLLEKLQPLEHSRHVRRSRSYTHEARGNQPDFVPSQHDPPAGVVSHFDIIPPSTVNRSNMNGEVGTHEDFDDEDDAASGETGDEVNALSAKTDRATSYVGPSSTMQLFRTILRIAPESMAKGQSNYSPSNNETGPSYQSHHHAVHASNAVQLTERTKVLIDAYFTWIHPATPILDEAAFREQVASGTRNDAGWLCLLNMVLVLGSIGSTKIDSKEHLFYYEKARSNLELESLGSKQIEILQALILMSGHYLHYRNRSNLASALLGVALRMSQSLGLHKESHSNNQSMQHQELRRRIWWNLVVFDAAESVSLGRSLDTKIFESEVHYPRNLSSSIIDAGNTPSAPSLLLASINFARVTTDVQGRLMCSPAISYNEILGMDAHLVDWYEALPPYFHNLTEHTTSSSQNSIDSSQPHSSSDNFVQPCATLKWRYLNLRIMVYRTSLMEAVMHRTNFDHLTQEQRICVRKCLTLSGETIASVAARSTAGPNQFIAWPATWWVLQVSIVPLLCLYTFRDDPEDLQSQPTHLQQTYGTPSHLQQPKHVVYQIRQVRDDCHRQIQTTLRLMKEMEPWAIASRRMHDMIKMLYEARNQPLRVWNNSEESPMVVLGTPSVQNGSGSSLGDALDEHRHRGESRGQPTSWSTASTSNMAHFTTPGQTQPGQPRPQDGSHVDAVNHIQPFSTDWSTYDNAAWQNASWDGLFDLPDEFQFMDTETFQAFGQ